MKKHDGQILSLAKGKQSNLPIIPGGDMGALGKSMSRSLKGPTPMSTAAGSPVAGRLSRAASSGRRSANRLTAARGNEVTVPAEGLSPTGIAKANRAENTQIQSGRGFGSPYRGEDPEKSINYRARDPVSDPLPPELMTGFKAVPNTERDFFRPFLRANDPERQQQILEMVSPRMGAMLEVGWGYTQNRPVSELAERGTPNERMQADITAHPGMGLGADAEATKIKTLEDSGMSAKEAGFGWQGAMEREARALGAGTLSGVRARWLRTGTLRRAR